MKDLGEATYILGIIIYRDKSRRLIGLSHDIYIDKLLKHFSMEHQKRVLAYVTLYTSQQNSVSFDN
jgi:hypothetical protein